MDHDKFQKQLEQFRIDVKKYAANEALIIIGKTATEY
jgi:hypothetical protein